MYVRFVSHYQDKVVRAKGCINSVRDSCTFPDCRSDGQCEVQVDAFLNSYCANETTISTGTTAPTVTVTQVRQLTTTTTVYSTTTVTSISYSIATDNVPTMYTLTALSNNTNNIVVFSKQRVTVTLGAVLGLLSLLLLMVATGWVWTYWVVRKRRELNANTRQFK